MRNENLFDENYRALTTAIVFGLSTEDAFRSLRNENAMLEEKMLASLKKYTDLLNSENCIDMNGEIDKNLFYTELASVAASGSVEPEIEVTVTELRRAPKEVAKELISQGVSVRNVAVATGLSVGTVSNLKKELELESAFNELSSKEERRRLSAEIILDFYEQGILPAGYSLSEEDANYRLSRRDLVLRSLVGETRMRTIEAAKLEDLKSRYKAPELFEAYQMFVADAELEEVQEKTGVSFKTLVQIKKTVAEDRKDIALINRASDVAYCSAIAANDEFLTWTVCKLLNRGVKNDWFDNIWAEQFMNKRVMEFIQREPAYGFKLVNIAMKRGLI